MVFTDCVQHRPASAKFGWSDLQPLDTHSITRWLESIPLGLQSVIVCNKVLLWNGTALATFLTDRVSIRICGFFATICHSHQDVKLERVIRVIRSAINSDQHPFKQNWARFVERCLTHSRRQIGAVNFCLMFNKKYICRLTISWIWRKYRQNCECCPVSLFIVRSLWL